MSAGSIALASGLSSILAISGEALTFRGSAVTGLVDRVGYRGQNREPDFSSRDMSRIEIAIDAVSPVPRVGETFTDASGYKHRIQALKTVGVGIIMECKINA